MITLIHGEDIVSSRNYYSQRKADHPNNTVLAGETMQLIEIKQILDGGSLFGDVITICIEDFFTKRKSNANDTKEIVDYLLSHIQNATIILWESKEISKTTIAKLKGAENKLFSLPQDVFAFLDDVFLVSAEKRVLLFHKALLQSEGEFIFYMLVRQIRILLALLEPFSDQIDEVRRLSPWQINKFNRQLRRTSKELLLQLFNKLYAIDIGQKTGQLPLTLTQSLDFFLLGF